MTFEQIFEDFKKTKYWEDMLNTREDSPYHREENVACHTRMVLAAYKDMFFHSRDPEQRLLTQIAILFHDTGKPQAETPKYSEKRGHYRSYGGHEAISACAFINYVCTHGNLGLTPNQLRVVRWMIENHLPYEKGPDKMNDWRIDATYVLGGKYNQCFKDLLLSDAKGRITDDNRFGQSVDWLSANLIEVQPKVREYANSQYKVDKKIAYFLVGPSSSGKSTVVNTLDTSFTKVFSKDLLRMDFYEARQGVTARTVEDYDEAWKFANENDKHFKLYVTQHFNQLVAQGWDIAVDNTNLTAKSRRQWVTILRQHGYYVIGIEFWNSLVTLLERGKARPDRNVPFKNHLQQYYSQSSVRFGVEVDEVRVVMNIPS